MRISCNFLFGYTIVIRNDERRPGQARQPPLGHHRRRRPQGKKLKAPASSAKPTPGTWRSLQIPEFLSPQNRLGHHGRRIPNGP